MAWAGTDNEELQLQGWDISSTLNSKGLFNDSVFPKFEPAHFLIK